MSNRILVIAGPSGVGKTTIAAEIERRLGIKKVITCTTRGPRPGEVDGTHYRFLGRDDFITRFKRGEFAEHAIVHQNLYGTLREDIERHTKYGEAVLLILDIQGMETLTGIYPEAQTFFIVASVAELMRRLGERNMPEELRKIRRDALSEELLGAHSPSVHNIINNESGTLDDAVERICAIVTSQIGHNFGRA